MKSHQQAKASSSAPISIRLNFDSYLTLLAEGDNLLKTEKFAAALTAYAAALKDCDFLPDAYIGIARAHAKMKNQDKAVASYRDALARSPENITAVKELASLFLGKDSDAFKAEMQNAHNIQKKMEIFRQDYILDITTILQKYVAVTNKTDCADEELHLAAIKSDHKHPLNGALVNAYLGNLALNDNKIVLAFYHFKQAEQQFKFDFFSQNKLSYIYLTHLKQPDAAKAILILAQIYKHPISYLYIGLAELALKDINSAAKYFRWALETAELYHFPAFEKAQLGEILKHANTLTKISYPNAKEKQSINRELNTIPALSMSTSALACGNGIQKLTKLLNRDILNPHIYAKRAEYYSYDEQPNSEILRDLTTTALLAFHQGIKGYPEEIMAKRNKILATTQQLAVINLVAPSHPIAHEEKFPSVQAQNVLTQNYLTYSQHYSEAMQLAEENKFLQAQNKLVIAKTLFPNFAQAYIYEAVIIEKQQNIQFAHLANEMALTLLPGYPFILNKIAKYYFTVNDAENYTNYLQQYHTAKAKEIAFKKDYVRRLKNLIAESTVVDNGPYKIQVLEYDPTLIKSSSDEANIFSVWESFKAIEVALEAAFCAYLTAQNEKHPDLENALLYYYELARSAFPIDVMSFYKSINFTYRRKIFELKTIIVKCEMLMNEYYYPPLYLLLALAHQDARQNGLSIYAFNIFMTCAENETFADSYIREDILRYLYLNKNNGVKSKYPSRDEVMKVLDEFAKHANEKHYYQANRVVEQATTLSFSDKHVLYALVGSLMHGLEMYKMAAFYYAKALTLAYELNLPDKIAIYDSTRKKIIDNIGPVKSYLEKNKNLTIQLHKFSDWSARQFGIYASEKWSITDTIPKLSQPSYDAMAMGYEAFLSKNYNAAIHLFTESLLLSPDNFIARTLRGICYLQFSDHLLAAEADFQDAVDEFNFPLAAVFGAEILFREKNKREVAKILYQMGLKRLSNDEIQLFKLTDDVIALLTDNDVYYEQARPEKYYMRALGLKEKDPEAAKLLFALGLLLDDPERNSEGYWHRSLCHLLTWNPLAALRDFRVYGRINLKDPNNVKFTRDSESIWCDMCFNLGSQALLDEKDDLAYIYFAAGNSIEKSKRFEQKIKECKEKADNTKKVEKQFNKTQARKKARYHVSYAEINKSDVMEVASDSSEDNDKEPQAESTVKIATNKKRKVRLIKKAPQRLLPKYNAQKTHVLSAVSDEALEEIAQAKPSDPEAEAEEAARKAKHRQNRLNKEKRKLMKELARKETLAKEAAVELNKLTIDVTQIADETESEFSDTTPSDDEDSDSAESDYIAVETDNFNTLFPAEDLIPLTEQEKSLFAKFATLTNQAGEKYTTLLVGGSVFDRALTLFFERLVKQLKDNPEDELLKDYLTNPIFKRVRQGLFYDDLDLVTEVPLTEVKAIAIELGWEGVNQFNADVMSFSVRGIKIDILHKEKIISPEEEISNRIFCQFLATTEGKLLDPSGRAFADLIHSRLTPLKPFAEAYQDPYAFFIALRQHIKRCLLIPTPEEMSTVLATIANDLQQKSTQFTLSNVNAYLKKIIHCNPYRLIESYRMLNHYHVFSQLCSPQFAYAINEYDDWVIGQLDELNNELRPSLIKFYAIFVVVLAMQEIGRDLYLKALNVNGFIGNQHMQLFLENYRANGLITQRCQAIIAKYPLLADAFEKKPPKDYAVFFKSFINDWFEQVYMFAREPTVSVVNTQASFFNQYPERVRTHESSYTSNTEFNPYSPH